MDFTQKIYKQLLETLIEQGYTFQTFKDFVTNPNEKVVVLRHDVDKLHLIWLLLNMALVLKPEITIGLSKK